MSEVVTPGRSLVEYTVVFKDDAHERLNGSFEFGGNEATDEAILGEIVTAQSSLDWAGVQRVLYTVSELMNNNVKIVSHEGEASGEQAVQVAQNHPTQPLDVLPGDYNAGQP